MADNSNPGLLVIVILLTLITAEAPTADRTGANSLQGLIDRVEAERERLDIPAVGLTLVNREGILWSGSLGQADRQSGRRASAETYYRIGSITKTFTAMAVLLLVEDGVLSLDDSLHELAPELQVKNRWRNEHPIRIKHLLEHTAGLTDLTADEFNNTKQLSLAQALQVNPGARVTHWPPGRHHSYTNVGAGLLSYVIEKKTGQRYENFVQERIFTPLHMHSASFFPDKHVQQGLATGYDSDGETVIPYWHMLFRAFGAINLKPRDMAPFLLTLLNHGNYQGRQLLSSAMVQRMETAGTSLAARHGLRFGYGAGMYTYLYRGHLFYGHGGDGDGYLSRFGYNRDSNMGYFVVINVFRDSDLTRIRRIVEEYITRDLPDPEKPVAGLTAKALDRLTGNYRRITWRFDRDREISGKRQLTIARHGADLFLQRASGRQERLVPVSANRFRFGDESVATLAFIESTDGTLYLQGDIGNYKKLNTP